MPASIFGNPAAVVQLNQALFGNAPGNAKFENQLAQANATSAIAFARQLGQTVATGNEALATSILANLGIVNATLQTALVQAFAAFPNDRGVVVLNLTNILTTLEGNAVYGAAAAQFNSQVATNFQYSNNPVNTSDSAVNAGTVTLTANTDTVTGNLFNAGLVFTPGGDDRINSLQDEDVLTGTGTNATLNATLGNANDNGGAVITPTITGVPTVNVAFTGSGGAGNTAVNELDLQDTTGAITNLNITRINDGITPTARIDNIGNAVANLSISRSGQVNQQVDFAFTAAALAGAADTTTLTLNQVNVAAIFVEERLNGGAEGFETINLVSGGTAPNTTVAFQAEDLRTLNISGGSALTIGGTANTTGPQGVEATRYNGGLANVAGSLSAINASALTANLDLVINGEITAGLDGTSGLAVNLTVTGGAGNDTFRLAAGTQVQAGDRIVGGAGTNTLQLLGNNAVATDGPTTNGPTVTAVQNLDIRTGQDADNSQVAAVAAAANAAAAQALVTEANGFSAAQVATAAAAAALAGATAASVAAAVGPSAGSADVVTVDARAIGDLATVVIRNEGQNGAAASVSQAETSTVNLSNVNAATANGINLLHSTSGSNGRANNNINITSTLAGVTTGGITIADGTNSNPRFNANVLFDSNGTANDATNTVVNVNIRDNDTESNTVRLLETARHTGTITITGTSTGFLNLDATANAYRYDQTGLAADGGTVIANTNGSRSDVGAGAAERIVAANFDSTAYAGFMIIRVSDNAANNEGGQSILFGAGNDTVIFDQINPGAANVNSAGLTINDTVNGGAGNDILGIDGHGVPITIGASEWTNVSNFEIIRVISNGAAVPTNNGQNQVNAYNLTLTNELLAANGTLTAGIKRITIVNDNDGSNDVIIPGVGGAAATAGTDDSANRVGAAFDTNVVLPATAVERGITIDARALNTTNSFVYNGEEGASQTADRFIFLDSNINGTAVINGGRSYNTGGGTNVVTNAGNLDVLEVRNSAVVSLGDIAGISNVSNFEFTNDTSADQSVRLTLDSAAVDRLVNDGRAADATNPETINISSFRSVNTVGADSALVLDAALVNGFFSLNVNTNGAAGQANIANDVVTLGANYGGAVSTINLGGGDDTVNVRNLAGTTPGAVTVNGNQYSFVNGPTTAATNLVGVEFLNGFLVNGTAQALTLTGTVAATDRFVGGNLTNDTFNLGGAGGLGDVVVLNSVTNADTITGYVVAEDSIELLASVFTAAGPAGALGAGQFVSVANAAALAGGSIAASTNAQAIIYIQDVDQLYYNNNGATAGGLTLIGQFNDVALVVGEFTLI